jgi:hypothetical protein
MIESRSIHFSIKITLLLLLTLNSQYVFSQYDFVDSVSLADPCGRYKSNVLPIRPFIENPFCWSDFEIETDSLAKVSMFTKLKDAENLGSYMYSYEDEEGIYTDSSSLTKVNPNNIRVIDYNKDGLPDFISSLWISWAKTLYTEFWRNTGDSWEFDMRIQGQLVEMSGDSIPWFKTYHVPCCGDYIHWINQFNLTDNSWKIKERVAFIGRFPRTKEPIEFSSKKTVKLNSGDTLLSYLDHNGVKLKGQELREFKAIAILKEPVSAKLLYTTEGPLNTVLKFVLLDPDAQFEKSFFRRDHRLNNLSKELKKDIATYYGGWMLDAKRST